MTRYDSPLRTPQTRSLRGRQRTETVFEYRTVVVGPQEPVGAVRAYLVSEAEQNRWELAKTILYQGGARKFWLRRKVVPVSSLVAGGSVR